MRIFPYLGCVAVLGLLLGCEAARVAVPSELQGVERVPVEGRQGWRQNQRIRFGDYETTSLDRSWVKGKDFKFSAYESAKRREQFGFVLAESGRERLGASCEATLSRRALRSDAVDVELRNRSAVFCSLFPSGEAARDWTLSLEESGERPLNGELNVGGRSYVVEGTRALAGGLPAGETSGYTISRGGQAIAVVEVIGNGSVVISPKCSSDERANLATAATALLLVEDLRTYLDSE